VESKYVLDTISNKDYYILLNGNSSVKYSKKTNNLDDLILSLKCLGVSDLEIIRDEANK